MKEKKLRRKEEEKRKHGKIAIKNATKRQDKNH
jgi:hypothetical protein